MDIYERLCRKEGLLPEVVKEEEVEVFEVESEVVEEEMTEIEEKPDIEALQRELECMKRRIQVMQLKLKMWDAEECPDEPCVDYEVELACSENREICALQKAQYKLQCQITELVRCCRFAKDQIADLRQRLCEKSREILELQRAVCILNTWRNTLEHEFGVCIERFEYLKHVKAEWADVEDKLQRQRKFFFEMEDKYVPKLCFVQEKKDFVQAIKDLHALFQELLKMHLDKFADLEQRISQMTQPVAAIAPAPAPGPTPRSTLTKTKPSNEHWR